MVFVATRQRDVYDLHMVAKGELIRSALQAIELNVFIDAHPEKLGKLPVKMILREDSNVAEAIDSQVVVQMKIDVLKHPVESRVIGVSGRFSQ